MALGRTVSPYNDPNRFSRGGLSQIQPEQRAAGPDIGGGGGGGGGQSAPDFSGSWASVTPQFPEPRQAPAPRAPDAVPVAPPPPPVAAGSDAMGAAGPLAGLSRALADPGAGFADDQAIGGAQQGLGQRTMSQPIDILRQIVAQRGRAY
jgi:hypothetical protein